MASCANPFHLLMVVAEMRFKLKSNSANDNNQCLQTKTKTKHSRPHRDQYLEQKQLHYRYQDGRLQIILTLNSCTKVESLNSLAGKL